MNVFRAGRWLAVIGTAVLLTGCAQTLGMRDFVSVQKAGTPTTPAPTTSLSGVATVFITGNGLVAPVKLTTDSSNNLYVADQGTGAADGQILEFTATGASAGVVASKLSYPSGVAVDASNIVYYSLGNGTTGIVPVPDNGSNAANFAGYVQSNPHGLLVSNGTLYVANASGALVTAFYLGGLEMSGVGWGTGGQTGFADGSTGTMKLDQPVDLAYGVNGFYIVDQGNNAIRVGLGSTLTTLAGGGGNQLTGKQGAAGAAVATAVGTAALFSSPSGIAVNAAGTYAYVADTGNNAIRKIDLKTATVTIETQDGLLNSPQGIAMGPDGNLYIANTGAGNILKMTP